MYTHTLGEVIVWGFFFMGAVLALALMLIGAL